MTLVAIRSVPELAEVKAAPPMAATATMIEMDVKGAEYKAGPMAIGLLPLRNATKKCSASIVADGVRVGDLFGTTPTGRKCFEWAKKPP
jgi:hypothetical protein